MLSCPHKLQELSLCIAYLVVSILHKTKERFASSPQRIRRVVLPHVRKDLYVASSTCCAKRAAGKG